MCSIYDKSFKQISQNLVHIVQSLCVMQCLMQLHIVNVNVNVNVYVYSLISHRVQQTSQFTPLVLELSLIRSHLLCGEFSAFCAANANHN